MSDLQISEEDRMATGTLTETVPLGTLPAEPSDNPVGLITPETSAKQVLEPVPQEPVQMVAPELSAGQMLRQAREAAGLHIAVLAMTLKLPLKRLEALEAERWDQLPDPVFVRAMASSVCRALKVDAAPILAKLPEGRKHIANRSEELGLNQPYKTSSVPGATPLKEHLSKPIALITGLIFLVALGVYVFPEIDVQSYFTSSSDTAQFPVEPAKSGVKLETTEIILPSSDSPAPASSEIKPLSSNPSSPSLAPLSNTATPATPAVPATPAAAPPPVLTGEQLVFRAKDTSWVEVIDSKGGVILRRNLEKNEVVGLSIPSSSGGAGPLSVVVGRSDVTEVSVRGKPFVMEAVTRENVARFQVK